MGVDMVFADKMESKAFRLMLQFAHPIPTHVGPRWFR